MMKPGTFVSVDGPNGVGKSTLIRQIALALQASGLTVHVTKEVTATPLGAFIREKHRDFRGKTLALLLAADRQNHLEIDILPSLTSHNVVITDRYIASSLVYQRLDGVERDFLWALNEGFLRPHLSVLVTANPEIIEKRMAERSGELDRFEQNFSRQEEMELFEEAATFLERKEFAVFRFRNDSAPLD
jgi:dTMP kinase